MFTNIMFVFNHPQMRKMVAHAIRNKKKKHLGMAEIRDVIVCPLLLWSGAEKRTLMIIWWRFLTCHKIKRKPLCLVRRGSFDTSQIYTLSRQGMAGYDFDTSHLIKLFGWMGCGFFLAFTTWLFLQGGRNPSIIPSGGGFFPPAT